MQCFFGHCFYCGAPVSNKLWSAQIHNPSNRTFSEILKVGATASYPIAQYCLLTSHFQPKILSPAKKCSLLVMEYTCIREVSRMKEQLSIRIVIFLCCCDTCERLPSSKNPAEKNDILPVCLLVTNAHGTLVQTSSLMCPCLVRISHTA